MENEEKLLKEEQFFLQFCRTIGLEKDTFFYMYDIVRNIAVFSNACTKYFNMPEVITNVRENGLDLEFILPESREEFERIHRAVEDGVEASGIVKLRQANGVEAIVEIKVTRILNEDGTPAPICFGTMKDVTRRQMLDQTSERYKKILMGNRRFEFLYDKKKDCFKFFFKDSKTNKDQERAMFFYSRLIEEGKVCSKEDITSLKQFIQYGSEIPIQIKFFDQFTEEYRWFAIRGKYLEDKPNELRGFVEDVNDLDLNNWKNNRLTKVLSILSRNYLLILEVNVLTGRYDTLLIDEERLGIMFEEDGIYEDAVKNLESLICKEHKKVAKGYCDVQELARCVRKREQTIYEYKVVGNDNKWHRVEIQRMDADQKGDPEKILFCIQFIDEEEIKNQNIALRQQMDEEEYKKQILVIEDYELNAAIMMDTIESLDMEGYWVSTKEEAVKEMQKQGNIYEMILLDDKLGEVSGGEIAKSIRSLNVMGANRVPIILCSVEDSSELDEVCEKSGITAHVSKPLTARQLKNLCEKYKK